MDRADLITIYYVLLCSIADFVRLASSLYSKITSAQALEATLLCSGLCYGLDAVRMPRRSGILSLIVHVNQQRISMSSNNGSLSLLLVGV